MANAPRSRSASRKQQNRVEREQKQRAIVMIFTITVTLLVVLVLGYGLLDQYVLAPRKPVAQVEDIKISIDQFQARTRYNRFQLIQNTIQLIQYNQLFQTGDGSGGFFDSQIQNNLALLDNPTLMGERVVDELINEAVIRIQAEKLGITVSDEELEQSIQEAFGYTEDVAAEPESTPTVFATATYSPQQLTLVPSTATPTIAPTLAEETSVTPTLSEVDEEIEATPQASPTPLPTATPFTKEAFQTLFDEYALSLEQEAQFDAESFRGIFRSTLLYDKVLEHVTSDVSGEGEWIWARHILVPSLEQAVLILERIGQGEDFADLAAAFSTDESNKNQGGDLGWFERGQMVAEFETAAYALMEIGQTSEPVETGFGYHIIQLLGKETRPVSSERLQQLKQEQFTSWLEGIKAEMDIEILQNWQNRVPTVPTLPPGLTF
jgi:peptidyl-prolyl cis-trans isomerase D